MPSDRPIRIVESLNSIIEFAKGKCSIHSDPWILIFESLDQWIDCSCITMSYKSHCSSFSYSRNWIFEILNPPVHIICYNRHCEYSQQHDQGS